VPEEKLWNKFGVRCVQIFSQKFKFEDENAGCAPNFRMDALNALVSSYNE
jgi:hypothetical protein